VIRRLFWLLAGAGLGISGYRRVTRVFRELARPGPRTRSRLRGLGGFARDVREGMDLYAEQQRLNAGRRQAPAGHTLGSQVTAASASGQGHRAARNGSPAPRAHR